VAAFGVLGALTLVAPCAFVMIAVTFEDQSSISRDRRARAGSPSEGPLRPGCGPGSTHQLRAVSSDLEGMRQPPPLWKIVWNDNASGLMAMIGPVLFVFALCEQLSGVAPGGRGRAPRPVDPEFARLATAVTGALMAALWAFAAVRVARIRQLFEDGVEVEATLRKLTHLKGWVRLRLELERSGTTLSVRTTVRRSAHADALAVGDRLMLLVDPVHPKRVVWPAIYTRAEPSEARSAPENAETDAPAHPWGVRLGLGSPAATSRDSRSTRRRSA